MFNLFPANYFLGAKRDTLTVTKCLGLTVYDTLYVYHTLGEDGFNQVLKAFKLQTPSPLSPDWECTGIPGYFNCVNSGNTRYDNYHTSRVGTLDKQEWHPFFGYFVCHNCNPKVKIAELKFYEANVNNLCINQKERMEQLMEQKNGNKLKCRENENTRKDKRYEDGSHREFLKKRDAQAKARGETKKSRLEHRYDESSKKFYKDLTKERMIKALRIFGTKSPTRHIYNIFLIKICDEVLKKEGELGNEVISWTPKCRLLVCLRHEYLRVKKRAGFVQKEGTKQYIMVPDPKTDDDIKRNKTANISADDRIDASVNEVYENLPSKNGIH